MRFGIAKRGATELHESSNNCPARSAPVRAAADWFYAELRADLDRRGLPVGGNNLLIAAQAMALGCTIVTDNEREFSRLNGLNVENCLR